MDFLFAKVKEKGAGIYKVLTDATIFDGIPDFTDARAYDDEYKLRDGEWFVLSNFSGKDYCPDLFKAQFESTSYTILEKSRYGEIKYIVSLQGDDDNRMFMVQNVTPSLLLTKQRYILFGPMEANTGMNEQARIMNSENILVLKNTPDCYYVKREDKLYFKNLSSITSVFKGINELYKEATDEEVQALFDLDMVNIDESFTKDKVKTANRRRIKEALSRYNNFSEEEKQHIPIYVSRYCPDLYVDGKFQIKSEKDLKELLDVINQRYYTTEIDQEKRVANSVTIVG